MKRVGKWVLQGFLFFIGLKSLYAQKGKPTWLDQAKHEHNRTRIAYGAKFLEPSGIAVQLFKGFFCSGHDTYSHRGTIELYAGRENLILNRNPAYRGGILRPAGIQAGVNYQYPLFCLSFSNQFTMQLHAGLGLQGGRRTFVRQENTIQDHSIAGLGFFRLSFTGKGFKMMDRYWFWSLFAEHGYFSEFGTAYRHWRPGFGIVLRKVR